MERYCSEVPIDSPSTYLKVAAACSIISMKIRNAGKDCMTYDGLEHHFPNTSALGVKVSISELTLFSLVFLLVKLLLYFVYTMIQIIDILSR